MNFVGILNGKFGFDQMRCPSTRACARFGTPLITYLSRLHVRHAAHGSKETKRFITIIFPDYSGKFSTAPIRECIAPTLSLRRLRYCEPWIPKINQNYA